MPLVLRAIGCAAPTQALIRVEFLAPCADDPAPGRTSITDYAVYVWKDTDDFTYNMSRAPVAQVKCGSVSGENTLMLYPRDTDSLDVIVQVVAGTRVDDGSSIRTVLARDCSLADKKACIRATRSFKYIRNDTLYLPIRLDTRCVGQVCDLGKTTCVAGECVSSSCSDGKVLCQNTPLPPAPTAHPSPIPDASGDTASEPLDADATSDAPFLFAFTCTGGAPPVRFCTGGKPTCYNVLTSEYDCARSQDCDPNQGEYKPCCAEKVDAGEGGRCCLTLAGAYPVVVPSGAADPCSKAPLCFNIGSKCEYDALNKGVCIEDSRGPSGWGECKLQ